MEYISTRNNKKTFSFKDVFLKGLAPDGGLFIPKKFKKYSQSELREMAKLNYIDLATKIVREFCGNNLQEKELKNIIKKSYSSFSTNPLKFDFIHYKKTVDIDPGIGTLCPLYYGPTLSFKDFAMQPIGNIYEHFLKEDNKKINIIVATSGDTGSAAIAALKGKSNINVFVFHPDNKISNIQRRLMTTIDSKNVYNLAIKGSFDDCQRLVKDMFGDKKFSQRINMSAVNSINWARVMFQIVYYFFITLQSNYYQIPLSKKKRKWHDFIPDVKEYIFSIPTGNFGNVYAGYVAKKMGLPIKKFLIATNKNDILCRVVNSGKYRPSKTKPSISPSMDIQTASNFERFLYDAVGKDDAKVKSLMNKLKNQGNYSLNNEEMKYVKKFFCAYTCTDETIKEYMGYSDYDSGYDGSIDPHTATATFAADSYVSHNKKDFEGIKNPLFCPIFILGTADPCKFPETVKDATGVKPKIPKSIKNILNKKENYVKLENDIDIIQNYILKKI